MKNQENSETQPEDMVSIGVWYLLQDLRRIFCEYLYNNFLRANNEYARELFTQLLNESLQHWNRTYKDSAFAKVKFQTESLIAHLESLKKTLKEDFPEKKAKKRWISFLENLIIPYVISIPSASDWYVRPWFPDNSFLKFYQATHSQNHKNNASLQNLESKSLDWEFDNPPLNLFITETAFSNLRPQSGVFQKVIPPMEESQMIQERLGSGMRALQSKLIGCYDDIFTKDDDDKFVDKLVGNGSALLFVLQETEWPPLGLVCFSSPVLWLFHELIFPPVNQVGKHQNMELAEFLSERKINRQRFRKSIFICANTLDQKDRKFLINLDFGASSSSSGRSRNGRYVHTIISDRETAKKLDLLICFKCDDNISEPCIFHGMSSWIEPTLGTFLRGLKQMVDTREHNKLRDMMAKLSHDIDTPLAIIISEFNKSKEFLPDADRKNFDKLSAELSILSSMLDSVPRVLGLKAYPNYFDEEAYTDIYSIFKNLRGMGSFSKIFERIKYQIGVPDENPQMFVRGHEGDWYIIVFNLLKNATKAYQEFNKIFPDKSPTAVIFLNYPADDSGEFSLEILNSSLELSETRLAEMRKCINGEQERIKKYPDESGLGLGLASIGEYISHYGFTASVEQNPDSFEVSIKISNIPVQKR